MGISFAFQTTCTLKNRTILKQWIKLVIENNNKKVGEIAYIFCSDEQLLEINKEFLNHDYYTDIITFDYSETITLSLSFEINKTSISNSESKSLSSLKTILENISSLHSIEKLTPPTHCSK